MNYAPVMFEMPTSIILTSAEREVVEHLKTVNVKSFWGSVIEDVFRDYSIEKARELLQTLLSQVEDNPLLMRDILGADCYYSLIRLKDTL